jgi:hypothetical protein
LAVDYTTYRFTDKGSFAVRALIAGIIGLAVSMVGWLVDSPRFYHAWLVAFAFWVSISLGGLFFTMLHHLVNAQWSTVIRKLSEAVTAPLPIMAIFFVPIIVGMHDLYHWTHADEVAHSAVLQWKAPYLDETFFVIRTVIFFAVWCWLSMRLTHLSRLQDKGHTPEITAKLRKTSAYGMLLFALTVTFAGFDWLMSLDPHWYSTIFGVYFFSGGLLTVICFLTAATLLMRRAGVLAEQITVEHYHDLGKLMFGFIIFWSYIAFSQYLLIWYANIPEETVWYLDRWRGSWKAVSLMLVFGYFAVPFLVMIFRGVKRTLSVLGLVAVWLLFMHWVDLYWLVLPSYQEAETGAHFDWWDLTTMIGIGGVFLWSFWSRFRSGPIVPVNDPTLELSLKHVNA